MNRYSILAGALGLFLGCATAPPPPLTADNPASPLAPEATIRPRRSPLAADDLTAKTRQIFAEATQRQQAAPTPTPHQGQMDQMPSMNMPKE